MFLFHAKECSRKQFSGDKASFPQKIPWDTLKPVSTNLPNFLEKKPIIYCSRTGNEKTSFHKNVSSKWSFGHLECKLRQPCWKHFVKGQTFFARGRKMVEKNTIFKRKQFSFRIAVGKLRMDFVNSAKILSHMPNFFSSRAESDCQNKFFIEKFPWTSRMQFWQLYRKDSHKKPIFFDQFQRMIKKRFFKTTSQNFPIDTSIAVLAILKKKLFG